MIEIKPNEVVGIDSRGICTRAKSPCYVVIVTKLAFAAFLEELKHIMEKKFGSFVRLSEFETLRYACKIQ